MAALECVEQNGFAIIRDVLSGQDITGVLSDFEDATLRHSRAGVRHAFDSAGITRFSRNPQLLEIARETLGEAAFPFRATLFDKSSAANCWWFGTRTQLCRFKNGTKPLDGVRGRSKKV